MFAAVDLAYKFASFEIEYESPDMGDVVGEIVNVLAGIICGEFGNQGIHSHAPTIAQDEQTCVVFGMPGAAVKIGAADEILPLQKITSRVMKLVSN
ncbi:MAG: hypothetical protein LH614_02775 [Pyrinomonadaceae bacterium]|nr:hypothetical protein [Pyrinomonadaceae bacterium]